MTVKQHHPTRRRKRNGEKGKRTLGGFLKKNGRRTGEYKKRWINGRRSGLNYNYSCIVCRFPPAPKGPVQHHHQPVQYSARRRSAAALLQRNVIRMKFTAKGDREGLLIVFACHDLWLFIFNGVGRRYGNQWWLGVNGIGGNKEAANVYR